MDQFTPQTPFDWIGIALVIGVVIRVGWAAFIDYCERTPIYDPMVDGPEGQSKDNDWPDYLGDDPDRRREHWNQFIGQSFSHQPRQRTFPQQHYYRYADGVETEGGHRE